MELNPYLMFNGNCEEAFRCYQQLFGGELQMMRYREMPGDDQVGPEWGDKLVHASLQLGNRNLMASDCPPSYQQPMQGFSLSLGLQDAAECDRIFNALAEGGKITMPLDATFWSERFGMCTDRFGVAWMVGLPPKS